MRHKGLLGCALHLSIASSLVLTPPQSLPEITTSSPIALDASSNTSVIQLAPIPSMNHGHRISNPASSLSLANITAPADHAALTQVEVSCNGAPFTIALVIYSSCRNAFRYTHSGGNVMTFGDRTSGDWDLNLPVRVMSGKLASSPLMFLLDLVKDKCWN